MIPLLAGLGMASRVAPQALNLGLTTGRKIGKSSIELFGYDFFGLAQKIIIIYVLAWFIEQFIKAKLFLSNLTPAQQVAGTFGGLGGLIISTIIQNFTNTNNQQPIENQTLQRLFGEGYELGGMRIKYWDVINALVLCIILLEWHRHYTNNESNDGKMSYASHGVFALFAFVVGFAGLPNVWQNLKTMQFNKEMFR